MNFFEKFNPNIFNKNLGSSQRYTAFTLAEVLITLGIIGVVAALTIPSLTKQYQKSIYETSIKKFYSVLQNNLRGYMAETGCSDFVCTEAFKTTPNLHQILKSCFKNARFYTESDKTDYDTLYTTELKGSTKYGPYFKGNSAEQNLITVDGAVVAVENFACSLYQNSTEN